MASVDDGGYDESSYDDTYEFAAADGDAEDDFLKELQTITAQFDQDGNLIEPAEDEDYDTAAGDQSFSTAGWDNSSKKESSKVTSGGAKGSKTTAVLTDDNLEQLVMSGTSAQVKPAASHTKAKFSSSSNSGSSGSNKAAVAAQIIAQAQAQLPGLAGNCKPRPDQCSTSAAYGTKAYCSYMLPHFSAKVCLGGCCISSGRCGSSSCISSGLGKDVGLMPCFGSNQLSNPLTDKCANLGCELYTPGCKNGKGSCVGRVVPLVGNTLLMHPIGRTLLGLPCLDMSMDPAPSLDRVPLRDGTLSRAGIYVGGPWKVCDCIDTSSVLSSPLDLLAKPDLTIPFLKPQVVIPVQLHMMPRGD